jgi:hypothetical protein
MIIYTYLLILIKNIFFFLKNKQKINYKIDLLIVKKEYFNLMR